MYKISTIGPDNLYVIIKVEHFKFLYNRFKNELLFVRDRMTKYYNIKRIKRLSFEKETKYICFIKTLLSNDQTINWTSKDLDPSLLYIKFRNLTTNYHCLKQCRFILSSTFFYSNLYRN